MIQILTALLTSETKHILQKSKVIYKVQEAFWNGKMNINFKENVNFILSNHSKKNEIVKDNTFR